MSENFYPVPLYKLLVSTLSEIRGNQFHGIPRSLFYIPREDDPFGFERYGRTLKTPVGVAAGPHTQLALNIVAAWLCGARYIELKTIQTLDELNVSKPCIDMQDEGYNCEWSQELKVKESFTEYLNAWILIHILHKEMNFSGPVGTLFNMSVGYNLEGIMKENVQWFFARMQDCSKELAHAKDAIRHIYPAIDLVEIPSLISDHVTLSTMHGCPPDEIEKIGLYLIRQKKLHTTIKLNPTLLGAENLRDILGQKLGFATEVPDIAFEHDLKYSDVLKILDSLQVASTDCGLQFGVKLTNTLESLNNKDVFGSSEPMMYMSGRALHPISVAVAAKLQNDSNGTLDISFSAGVDCFNIAEVLACGLKPVTVCSDLLKPGGYGRLHQYIENIRTAFAKYQCTSLASYIQAVAGSGRSVQESQLENLNNYAKRLTDNPAYHKKHLADPSVKTARELGWFDCIHAPCVDTCPTNQDIPQYMQNTAQGDYSAAFEAIFATNPFPSVTGMICDHLCQFKCTRINYDEPLQIREIKRFVAGRSSTAIPHGDRPGHSSDHSSAGLSREKNDDRHPRKAAIIGAGPAGLSCAWFLRKAGFAVDIFEQKDLAGGMVSAAIPSFRLTSESIETDITRILASGIQLHDNHAIDHARFLELQRDYNVIFLASGAQRSVVLKIAGVEAEGVIDPLEFLYGVNRNHPAKTGGNVVIIGGGNTAMDAARTAFRLVGAEGTVTVVYRRTIREMPADRGEIEAVRSEGIQIMELTSPVKVISKNNKVSALVCLRNVLAIQGVDGRRVPVSVPGSEFEISCDTIIPAIGQELAIDFISHEALQTSPGSYLTRLPGVYIGGDAMRGASTAINAIGDGRKAAAEIIKNSGISVEAPSVSVPRNQQDGNEDLQALLHKKSIREYGYHPKETALDQRKNFDLVISSLSESEARKEAARCLQCNTICNVCVSVCPNLANYGYFSEPVSYSLQKAVLKESGQIVFEYDKEFRIGQHFQVMNIRDLCNECGNCTTFCPTNGRPFADKPGICLSVESLNREEKGFYLSRLPGRIVLIYKEQEHIKTLTRTDDHLIYETDQVRAVINPDDFSLVEVTFLTPCVREFRFEFAAEMRIVMTGISLNPLTHDS